MSQVPIPQTLGRLSQSCDIFSSKGGNLGADSALNSFLSTNDLQAASSVDPLSFLNSVVALLGTAKSLGSIEKLEVSQTRDIDRIYSLGSYAFEPYRVVPRAVKTSLNLSKIVLYKEDFLKSVGFNSYNIYYQQAPFIIRQTLINPTDPDADPDVILFFDCWIASNPFTFDLSSGDNLVKQNVRVECGRVFSSGASFINNAASTRKLSRKNIPFSS